MRSRPVFEASKFREIAALAKRKAGTCFGLIDSVARHRKKLWKSIEGHRQFLRLKPPYFHAFHTFPVFDRNHLVPPIFYTVDFVSSHPDYCSN